MLTISKLNYYKIADCNLIDKAYSSRLCQLNYSQFYSIKKCVTELLFYRLYLKR